MKKIIDDILNRMREKNIQIVMIQSPPTKPPSYDSNIPFMIDSFSQLK